MAQSVESPLYSYKALEMFERSSTRESIFMRRSQAPRPLSEATEILDTDIESDFSDEEPNSPRISIESFGKKSDTTLSSYDELPTPSSNQFTGFDFQLDEPKPVEGPRGPHLFRSSSISSQNHVFHLSLSPMSPERESKTPIARRLGRSVSPSRRPFSHLTEAVSHLNTAEVRNWTPRQVATWMYESGFEESVVEKFESNDISGAILVDLKFEDLKELDIPSFGKRHRLWTEIHNLRGSGNSSPEGMTPIDGARPGRSSKSSSRNRQLADCPSDEEADSPRSKHSPTRRSRRSGSDRRHRKHENAAISPLESVSIVGIEQLLPKPHKCAKGENCSKFRRQQRQLTLLAQEFPLSPQGGQIFIAGNPGNPHYAEDMTRPISDAVPSVVASSDVLGPSQYPEFSLQEESLRDIQSRDPQENVKQFLTFQHLQYRPEYYQIEEPSTPPLEMFPALQPPPTTPPAHEFLKCLPKLQIPAPPPRSSSAGAFSPTRTVTPSGVYRFGTPCSDMDVPVTALPLAPVSRDMSQSAPPDMRHRREFSPRSAAQSRRPSFAMAKVDENTVWQPLEYAAPVGAVNTSLSDEKTPRATEINHAGWMKKRKTKLLRHEWQDRHFRLTGTKLAMCKDDRTAEELEQIDVDDFAVACSSLASSTKLGAAFKSMKLSGRKKDGDDTAFSFQLIPAAEKKGVRHAAGGKTHHFAVKTRDERIDWMRELMLAKALKQKSEGYEINVNGNMI